MSLRCVGTAAVTELLAQGSRIEAVDDSGLSPLMMAATGGRTAVARRLLDLRADIDRASKMGSTALARAVVFGREQVVELLLSRGAGFGPTCDGISALHLGAALRCGVAVVHSLLAARADVEGRIRPRRGTAVWALLTAMSMSYRCGRRSFRVMVGRCALGATPLMLATMLDNSAEAQALLDAGACDCECNDHGDSVVDLADLFGSSCIVRRWSFMQASNSFKLDQSLGGLAPPRRAA